MEKRVTLAERVHRRLFDLLFRRSLVFNTCWEDPWVDRQALCIGPDDSIMVITSAGCNTLDYALADVFLQIPIQKNYFWTVYMRGHYTPECCPDYLMEENFLRLKEGLVDRIHIHNGTVTSFLEETGMEISKFVLLDHMDWLGAHQPEALRAEWEQILARARPGARVIFRSGSSRPAFLESLHRLVFLEELAAELHRHDRVRTYASFHIAEIKAA